MLTTSSAQASQNQVFSYTLYLLIIKTTIQGDFYKTNFRDEKIKPLKRKGLTHNHAQEYKDIILALGEILARDIKNITGVFKMISQQKNRLDLKKAKYQGPLSTNTEQVGPYQSSLPPRAYQGALYSWSAGPGPGECQPRVYCSWQCSALSVF